MPNGKVHAAATLGVTVLAAGEWLLATGNVGVAVGLAVGGLSGLLLGPDLDVDTGNISVDFVRRAGLGDLGALAWRLYWYWYAIAIPHRSFWSHAPVVSTLLRCAYVLAPVIIVRLFLPFAVHFEAWYLYWFIGLCLSDAMHWCLDMVSDEF